MSRPKGFVMPPEHRARIAAALKGKPKSAEARASMSAAKKGKMVRPMSADNKLKLIAANRGRSPSDEARAMMSAAKKARPTNYWLGKKRGPMPEEWRDAIGASNRGKAKPESFAEKMRASRYGQRFEYKNIQFRSGYERRVAIALDSLNVPWQYESHNFDLGIFRYRPDFYLPEDDAFWEVKGWLDPKSKVKITAFRSAHPEIPLVVVMKDAIEILEHATMEKANVCTGL